MSGKAKNGLFGASVGLDGLIFLLLFQLLLFHCYLACKKMTTYEFIIKRRVAPSAQTKKVMFASATEAQLIHSPKVPRSLPVEAIAIPRKPHEDFLATKHLQSDTGRPVESSTNMDLTRRRADLVFDGDQQPRRDPLLPRKSELLAPGRANG